MKKWIYYSVIAVVLVAIVLLLLVDRGGSSKPQQRINSNVTFKKDDKIPYGCYIAYNRLKDLFPLASITPSTASPGYWDSLSNYRDGQALVVVSPNFFPSEFEMKLLARFTEAGNTVIISAENLSNEAEEALHSSLNIPFGTIPPPDFPSVRLLEPVFKDHRSFFYPGYTFQSWFDTVDPVYADSVGKDQDDHINLIHLKVGKGHFYVHTAPLALTNYFLLQGDNLAYYENLFSLIPPDVRTIVWDEYFLAKKYGGSSDRSRNNSSDDDQRGMFGELARYPALLWFMITCCIGLLLYTFNESRRKQRFIPEIKKPLNDSLDFARTIGRLYFDRGDHSNLARKMASYFLEYIRSKYKLPTNSLDDDFIERLNQKSGFPAEDLRAIIVVINRVDSGVNLSAEQLTTFYKQLETFYQKA